MNDDPLHSLPNQIVSLYINTLNLSNAPYDDLQKQIDELKEKEIKKRKL
jgi:hypothetical protein